MTTYLHGQMDYAITLKPHFRVEDLDRPENKRVIPVEGWRRKKAHRATFVATQTRAEPAYWKNSNCTRRNGMWLSRR